MKYIVILGDGMADRPLEALGGKTPLETAHKPNIDALSKAGELGLVKTIPDGLSPGSDTANLSVMGYDPRKYYTGRAPLEAVSMGLEIRETDRIFRCNLVTLSNAADYRQKTMVDYSAGEITTEEAGILLRYLAQKLDTPTQKFYPGISYRHCMVWDAGPAGLVFTPPHDISDRVISAYLPDGRQSGQVLEMMEKSYALLSGHPVNLDRIKRGLNPANSIWLWGDGTKPQLPDFSKKYGISGAVISAVDLIKGIGICANMTSIDVAGATGTVDTNFAGKAAAAINALKSGHDFVYIHMEAPDECGHHGDAPGKVRSIELIDKEVVGPVLAALQGQEYAVLVLPDHPTPIETRTHCMEPVPYVLYRSAVGNKNGEKSEEKVDCVNQKGGSGLPYSEQNGRLTGLFISEGHTLMDRFIGKNP